MTQTAEKSVNWALDFFDDLFAEHCLMTRSAEEVAQTVAFFRDVLRLDTGDMIFDQCCGVGTLSLALARAGFRTHGVDLIPAYIAQARKEAAVTNSACHFAAGDAYTYTTPYLCDGAINWWTSFGYTPDDAQNAKMLESICASLKPGAWFALDYMNAAQRRKQLGASGKTGYRQEKENCTIACDSRLDGDMLVKDWVYIGKDGKRVERNGGGVKLYTPLQLRALLEGAGFRKVSLYGSITGEHFTNDSLRCITVAQKPRGFDVC